jgi:hypothetical protein
MNLSNGAFQDWTATTSELKFTPLSTTSQPTAKEIDRLKKEATAAAIDFESWRGGGNHGHLHLVINPALYNNFTNGAPAFDIPNAPDGNGPHIGGQASAALIAQRQAQFKQNAEDFKKYNMVKQALKRALLTAVPEIYIKPLSHRFVAYANVTPLQILEHLEVHYGTITRADLDENEKDMKTQWNPHTHPVAHLWTQIKQAQDFAPATDAILEPAALRSAINNVKNTNEFDDDVKKFEARPAIQQTLANFTSDIQAAYNLWERNKLKSTNQDAGYHGANAATTPTGTNNGKSTTKNTLLCDHYCWTHGLGYDPEHTSATCRFKATGHKDDATRHNKLGGNTNIRRMQGERTIYERTYRNNRTNTTATQEARNPA